ncbi:extracellular solute-binding protein [Uliginosibacterium sp. 31-12]|uniref:extracellular solute-binding protein n=1 Tax=Uliginosibacterium sp. 31-12 TaxID=3062781 RepID=UPI0026E46107|nr:extracellular solute-binding protein [Uliginosibacterium sp. 31-12]MDO6386176.1 extracellular solute-binding protein [Uliginosibacterium sp. 31-12]
MTQFPLRAGTLLTSLVLAAAAMPVHAAPAKAAPAKTPATPVQIELSHGLGADKGAQLLKLVERFNAANPGSTVMLSERHWSEGAQPVLSIVAEADEENFLSGPSRFKPLWQVMKDAREPLNTLRPGDVKVMVPSSLDSAGRLQALPVALSTPVMFYNVKALEAVGINGSNLPKNWNDWQTVLGKLVAAGQACPMTVSQPVSTLLENASAWNNQAFVTGGKNEQIAVNGLIQVKHLAKMSTWYKARYLHYFGRGNEGEARFARGDCAVLAAPSGAYPTLVREAGFEVGVGGYPYHDDAYGAPQNTWADGPALWVASGKSAAEYKLAARFIRFWLSAQSQVEWQLNSGYLPLSEAGLLATQASKLLRDELVAQRVAISQLTYKPVTSFSYATAFAHRRGVRRVLAEEMEAVFADQKPPKQGLDDAVQRIKAGEQGCCRPLATMPAGQLN